MRAREETVKKESDAHRPGPHQDPHLCTTAAISGAAAVALYPLGVYLDWRAVQFVGVNPLVQALALREALGEGILLCRCVWDSCTALSSFFSLSC